MFDVGDGVVNMGVDSLDLTDLFIGNVLEHLQLVVLVMLETLCTQVHTVLQTLVHVYEFVFGAVVSDLALINLPRYTVHYLCAGHACVRVTYAVDGPQQRRRAGTLHVRQLVQVLLCELRVRPRVVGLRGGVPELHLLVLFFAEGG